MGVKGLYSYLKHYRNDIDPRELPAKRVGIDAMSLLYRFKGDSKEIWEFLKGLKAAGHTLFFVFDGKPPAEKEREIQNRKDSKAEAASQATSIEAFLKTDAAKDLDAKAREVLEQSLLRAQTQSWHMTRDMRRAFQEELWKEGIPYVKSLSEADDVLIDMVAANKLDVVLSSDMDFILGGVPVLWIPTKRGTFHLEEIRKEEVLEGERLTEQGLIDAGLLCGTEERAGAKGVPCLVAFSWMAHYGSLEGLLRSNVKDKVMRSMFPDGEAVAAARKSKAARGCYERMRPDHLERVKTFLESL